MLVSITTLLPNPTLSPPEPGTWTRGSYRHPSARHRLPNSQVLLHFVPGSKFPLRVSDRHYSALRPCPGTLSPSPMPSLLLLALIHLDGRLVRGECLGDEPPNLLLVRRVLGILARGDQLRQPRRALEQHDEKHRANGQPAVEAIGSEAGPLVQSEPDGLLGRKVGVARECPESGGDEAALQIGLLEATRDLGGLLVLVLGLVEVYKASASTFQLKMLPRTSDLPHCCWSANHSVRIRPSSTAT